MFNAAILNTRAKFEPVLSDWHLLKGAAAMTGVLGGVAGIAN